MCNEYTRKRTVKMFENIRNIRKKGEKFKMTDYEKNKIIGIIKCMSEEEREVVIFALEEIYGRGAENEEE